jgi:hypothetical protein
MIQLRVLSFPVQRRPRAMAARNAETIVAAIIINELEDG